MSNRLALLLIVLLLESLFASIFKVDSVRVDSIWSSDSSGRISRDMKLGFVPIGTDSVELKEIELSRDNGLTWDFPQDSLLVLNNGLTQKFACNKLSFLSIRVLGGNRENSAFRVTVRQKKAFSDTFYVAVWDTSARWLRDSVLWTGCGALGNLDGPKNEVMLRRWFMRATEYDIFDQQGYPNVFVGYDAQAERYHAVAGNSWGYLDGPFSRARWRGQSYSKYANVARSQDGRYLIISDPNNGNAIRVLDLDSQWVSTLLPANSGAQAFVMNNAGQVMVLMQNGRLITMDVATKQIVKDITLTATQGLSLGPMKGLALDEVHNRLYAGGTISQPGNWHVWYFDLSDGGSFHGVLTGTYGMVSYCGSFDGYVGYGECALRFGPNDPEKRYLYSWGTDLNSFVRLDLQARIVTTFSSPPSGQTGYSTFGLNVSAINAVSSMSGPSWLTDGSIILPMGSGNGGILYRRVK